MPLNGTYSNIYKTFTATSYKSYSNVVSPPHNLNLGVFGFKTKASAAEATFTISYSGTGTNCITGQTHKYVGYPGDGEEAILKTDRYGADFWFNIYETSSGMTEQGTRYAKFSSKCNGTYTIKVNVNGKIIPMKLILQL